MAVATAARAATVLLDLKIGFPFGLVLMALSAESLQHPVTRPWMSVAGLQLHLLPRCLTEA